MTEPEFVQIYHDHAAVVFRFCAFRTGSASEAEDLTAEAFARLLAKGDRVAPEKRVAWLHTVARNLCADFGRRRRWASPSVRTDAGDEGGECVWLDPRVRNAVAHLSAEQQQVLFLRAVEDLSFAGIGSALGISETAARMRFHRAVKRLRPMLTEVRTCPDAETT